MEPNDDLQLRRLLKEWTAPATPPLEQRVMDARRSWWSVVFTGYIRVPIPVACGLALLMAIGIWRSVKSQTEQCGPPSVACRDASQC